MIDMQVKDYLIRSDENNITVEKLVRDDTGDLKTNKDNKSSTTLVGYYPSLKHALRGIQKNYVYGKGTHVTNIDEYRQALDQITTEFENKIDL